MKALYRLFVAAFVCAAVWGMPLDAMASGGDTVKYSGTSKDITWTIYDNGLLKLTGTGDYQLSYNGLPPWSEYSSNISTAVVNISGITSTSYMFYNCSSLTSLDLSNFNTSQVTNMESMFWNCSSLTSLDLSNFNTSKMTKMVMMFSGCSSLTSLDLSNFNTSQVTNMSYVFYGCGSLTSLDLSNFNMSQVTYMDYMFGGFNNLETLHTPKSVQRPISLPSANDGKRWYMGQSEVTYLPQNLAHSVKLVRQSTPPGSENPGGGSTSPNPGQQLPNTAAEDDTAFHIMMFGMFAGLAFFTYGLKRKYARGEGYGR